MHIEHYTPVWSTGTGTLYSTCMHHSHAEGPNVPKMVNLLDFQNDLWGINDSGRVHTIL